MWSLQKSISCRSVKKRRLRPQRRGWRQGGRIDSHPRDRTAVVRGRDGMWCHVGGLALARGRHVEGVNVGGDRLEYDDRRQQEDVPVFVCRLKFETETFG